MDAGTKLTEGEQQIVRGIQEMQDDLLKEPALRKRGVAFQERYEKIELKAPPAKRQKK